MKMVIKADKANKLNEIIVVKELRELEYKDDEISMRFEFNEPHFIKLTYSKDEDDKEYVGIDDDEFSIYVANKTEDEVMFDYICYLDFLWDEYVISNYTKEETTRDFREHAEIIKAKVRKIW